MGSSTKRTRRRSCDSAAPCSERLRHSSHQRRGSAGLQEKRQSSTTSISGSRRDSARTAVDFAVPRSPRISTPPMAGLMALSSRAVFIESWPTRAVKGMTVRACGMDCGVILPATALPSHLAIRWYNRPMPARPLHVLLDASCLRDGRRHAGIGRYARELRDALQAEPLVNVAVAIPPRAPRSEARPARYLSAQPTLLRAARRLRPDVLHALGGEPRGARGTALDGFARALTHRIRDCAAVITPSQSSADDAVAVLGLDRGRITVIPHGVTPLFTDVAGAGDLELRRLAGVTTSPYVLWTGSLRHHDPRKDVDALVDALARVRNPALRLVLVGAGGPELQRLARRAEDAGVTLLHGGRCEDRVLAALYRGAGAVAIPSRHEGFGLPMLEAMACGAPVVASAAGNLTQLGADAALLVPPGDVAALSGALRTVLDDPAVAGRLRGAGVRRAAGYTWRRTAEQTIAVYQRVAADAARGLLNIPTISRR